MQGYYLQTEQEFVDGLPGLVRQVQQKIQVRFATWKSLGMRCDIDGSSVVGFRKVDLELTLARVVVSPANSVVTRAEGFGGGARFWS